MCIAAGCGNNQIDQLEVCDDGNATSGDGCRSDCRKIEMCGDAIADEGESCDDGNDNAADGCDACVATRWTATAKIGGGVTALGIGLDPKDIAADRHGNLYIAEASRVRRVDTTGVITTIAGNGAVGGFIEGGQATSSPVSPAEIDVDGLGNLYIRESWMIRRVDRRGVITTIEHGGLNVGGFAVDGLGNIYMSVGHSVRRLAPDGTITIVVGTGAAGYSGDGGLATSALLRYPGKLGFDKAGNLFIADRNNYRVRRVDTLGVITTVAGNGTTTVSGDGGAATSAGLGVDLFGFDDLSVDADGVFYISARERIRRVGTDGIITTIVGNGVRGSTGNGGLAIAAQLWSSSSVVAHDGVIDLIDPPTIRRIDAMGMIKRFAGSGQVGDVNDGGGATGTNLGYPDNVVSDGQGNLYIATYTRVRKVDAQGTITTIAGIGRSGSTGDGGPAIEAQIGASSIALDPAGLVYIADYDGNRIRKVDANGIITTVVGTGIPGFSGDGGPAIAAELRQPGALTFGADGVMYIADRSNYRIRRVGLDGMITTIAGPGTGALGDGGPAIDAEMAWLKALSVDSQNRLVISDSGFDRVRRIDTNGIITTVAGNGVEDYTGDGGPATDASFADPGELALDAAGNIYVADSVNYAIRRIDTNGVITTVVGGVYGPDGDGGPAATCKLEYTFGLEIDNTGNMFIGDTDDRRVRRVSTDGTITTVAGHVDPQGVGPIAKAQLADPRAFVITPDWHLVAGGSSGTVQAVSPSWVSTVIGRYPHFEPTETLARFRDNNFGTVSGVAYDASAKLVFLTEGDQLHAVTVVDSTDAHTWTFASLGDGSAGFVDGAIATARFRSPTGLHFDATNRKLYVADTGNHVIRMIDLMGGLGAATVSTIAGKPATRGFFGDGNLATNALLYQPRAMSLCSNGDLFVADTGNHRIRRIAAGTKLISTVLGDGVAASSGEGTPASTFPVDTPSGLACDARGNLFATSMTTVRLVPADASGIVDGTGGVQTIYGAAPRDVFPASVTSCLTGLQIVDATTLQVTDACIGMLVELRREPNS